MKDLQTFYMEDHLESYRFQAKYNLGESGGRPRKVEELLLGANLQREQFHRQFDNILLCDSPNWGREDLREIVASFHPGATKENVLITTGTSEALFLLFRYLKPKKIALPLPGFQLLSEIPKSLGAQIIPLPVLWDAQNKPYIEEEEWFAILQKETPDCLLINNPHNPSGLIFRDDFLNELCAYAAKTNISIIGDEHYRFLSSENMVLGSTLFKQAPRHFVTGSFIKCLGSPGLRIGWCLGPPEDLKVLQNEKNYTTHTVNPISEWIAFEVLKNLESPLWRTMRAEWRENRQILQAHLERSPLLLGVPPAGGLVSALGFSQKVKIEPLNRALLEQGIFLLPLHTMEFAENFAQYSLARKKLLSPLNEGMGFRLGLGIPGQKLQEALGKIDKIAEQNLAFS